MEGRSIARTRSGSALHERGEVGGGALYTHDGADGELDVVRQQDVPAVVARDLGDLTKKLVTGGTRQKSARVNPDRSWLSVRLRGFEDKPALHVLERIPMMPPPPPEG